MLRPLVLQRCECALDAVQLARDPFRVREGALGRMLLVLRDLRVDLQLELVEFLLPLCP